MSNFDLIITPTSVQMELVGNTGLFPSPLIASAQTIDRGGLKWKAVLSFMNKRDADRAELMALIAELNGQSNRLRIPVSDNPARGAYGGTPVVNGGGQTGKTINIDGLSDVANWIRRGDYFSIDVNGEHELKICTADKTSSAGAITGLAFEPALRASPLNNAAIYVQDGVLSNPEGVFVMEGSLAGWASRPGAGSKISNLTLNMIEDVFATQ